MIKVVAEMIILERRKKFKKKTCRHQEEKTGCLQFFFFRKGIGSRGRRNGFQKEVNPRSRYLCSSQLCQAGREAEGKKEGNSNPA